MIIKTCEKSKPSITKTSRRKQKSFNAYRQENLIKNKQLKARVSEISLFETIPLLNRSSKQTFSQTMNVSTSSFAIVVCSYVGFSEINYIREIKMLLMQIFDCSAEVFFSDTIGVMTKLFWHVGNCSLFSNCRLLSYCS